MHMSHARPWRESPDHRRWLMGQAEALFAFFEPESLDPKGGFHALDFSGHAIPSETERPLHATTRMAHCFAIAHLMGRPGAADILDHAMDAIWNRHRDAKNGGYFWSFDANGPRERDKLAYGHAFVLLAASSAKCAGHPDADRLIADITEILETKFWENGPGVSAEEFREDWSVFSEYRGQNSNMHLTEALMAAFEATGEKAYLDKAERIADRILRIGAGGADWRVPEHYHSDWRVDPAYIGPDVFRPHGYTPGHAMEWARLALQLWALGGKRVEWLPDAARRLFAQAVAQGWDPTGGLYYTLNYDGSPRVRDRLWWPICEGIGAAHFLGSLDGDDFHEGWYRRLWGFAARRLIDAREGGWKPQLNDALEVPAQGYFTGKPDIYHALQACLIPLHGTDGSLTRGILGGREVVERPR